MQLTQEVVFVVQTVIINGEDDRRRFKINKKIKRNGFNCWIIIKYYWLKLKDML